MSNSSGRYKQRLIFCGGEPAPTTLNDIDIRLETRDAALALKQEEEEEKILQASQEEHIPKKRRSNRPSAYVTVFESMIRAVMEGEAHLLSENERNALAIFSLSNYYVRYCLTRLLMRKPKQWIPISSLGAIYNEIEEFATPALHFLCLPIDYSVLSEDSREEQEVKMEAVFQDLLAQAKGVNEGNLKKEPSAEVIDLTMDDNACKPPAAPPRFRTPAIPQNAKAGPSRLSMDEEETLLEYLQRDIGDLNLDFFCEDESAMNLDDALNTLSKEQLVEMAQEFKCKLGKSPKKVDILECLRKIALDQGIIKFASPPRKGKKTTKPDGFRQTQLMFASKKPKESVADRMRARALSKLGPCIRVNYDFYRLAHRLHIICYREMDRPTTLCLPELLSTFKKRHYTAVEHMRTTDIWRERQELLDYEKALEANRRLDEELERIAQMKAASSRQTSSPGSISAGAPHNQTPVLRRPPSTTSLKGGRETPVMDIDTRAASEAPVQVKKEDVLKEHLETWILPRWQELVRRKDEENSMDRPPGLARFESGYVYTRLVYKAAAAYGPLKEYHKELEVLGMLLAQKHWRKSKRGEWYERRAVIYGHLARGPNKITCLLQSLEGLKEALRDEDTGTVYRPKFIKRIAQLEKVLKIPEEERVKCEGQLKAPNVISINAEKVDPDNLPEDMQEEADLDEEKENWRDTTLTQYNFVCEGAEASSVIKLVEANEPSKKKMGKSKWRGRYGTIVDVETRALQHYEDLGYKGMHAETSILTMLFALLFWDIIFASVPGAFETPFQTCPLDMFEDAFYYARKQLIERRIAQIREGKACEILSRHDDQYRPKATWCLGVNWELCSKEELLQIVECMGGSSLAHICNLFCQDYSGRCSGGPDLIVWNYASKICKFVEVKGPGDTARANQTLWFDSLKRADTHIDLCKVVDVNEPPKQKKPTKAASTSTKRKKTVEPQFESEPSSEVNYDLLDDSDTDSKTITAPLPARSPKKRRISA